MAIAADFQVACRRVDGDLPFGHRRTKMRLLVTSVKTLDEAVLERAMQRLECSGNLRRSEAGRPGGAVRENATDDRIVLTMNVAGSRGGHGVIGWGIGQQREEHRPQGK